MQLIAADLREFHKVRRPMTADDVQALKALWMSKAPLSQSRLATIHDDPHGAKALRLKQQKMTESVFDKLLLL